MKQITAVEWLNEMLRDNHKEVFDGNIWEQAKAMERQQMFECWETSHQAGRFEGKGIAIENWQTFKKYYNQTFKSE